MPDSALQGLLLSAKDLDAIMGTSGLTAHGPVVTVMGDNRNLLPNLDCLGVWQIDQAPIYDPSNWKAVRQQLFRAPDVDQWDYQAVQSVVSYSTPSGARDFVDASALRWAKCTNPRVNIRLTDTPLPAWHSGDLTRTDQQLSMPYARGAGASAKTCQRVLAVTGNVVIDAQACTPQQDQPISAAVDIAKAIDARMPR